MWAILYSMTVVYGSYGTGISTEMVGNYQSLAACQDVAKQLSGQSEISRSGFNIEKYATARCIQVKDKP